MSATSPPGEGQRWPQLLAYVVDDDDRTRRANLLLWRVTVCLLAAGTVLLATVALMARAPGWYTGVGGSAVALFLGVKRARRLCRAPLTPQALVR